MPFINMHRYGGPSGEWQIQLGAPHLTLFKTYRNARGKGSSSFWRSRGLETRVFWFDVKYLPEVIDEEDIAPLVQDRMTELEHAERQIKLWVERYEALAKEEGPPQLVGSNVRPGDNGKRRKARRPRVRGISNVRDVVGGVEVPVPDR